MNSDQDDHDFAEDILRGFVECKSIRDLALAFNTSIHNLPPLGNERKSKQALGD